MQFRVIAPEPGNYVDVGQVGTNEQRGRGKAGAVPQPALRQGGPQECVRYRIQMLPAVADMR
jgi:hypothetical protein